MTNTKYHIVNGSMGAFLNPPNDVEHKYIVEEIDDKKNQGHMTIRTALSDEHVPDWVKNSLRKLMEENKGELTEEWEHSCYNYFRNCYSPDGSDRNVSNMVVDKTNSLPTTHHLAVLHIQKYFPDYTPNEFLIANNGNKGSWSIS